MYTFKPFRRLHTIVLTLLSAGLALLPFVSENVQAVFGQDKIPAKSKPSEKLSFNRDIRPILVENCFACHGPDSASRKAGLRLDQRELAIKAGAIVPGKPEESDLVQRIFARPRRRRMPPPRDRPRS